MPQRRDERSTAGVSPAFSFGQGLTPGLCPLSPRRIYVLHARGYSHHYPQPKRNRRFTCEEFMDRNPRSWRLHCGLRLRYAVLSVAVAAWVLAQGDALSAAPLTWIAGATVLSPEQKDSGRQLNVLVDGERIAVVT